MHSYVANLLVLVDDHTGYIITVAASRLRWHHLLAHVACNIKCIDNLADRSIIKMQLRNYSHQKPKTKSLRGVGTAGHS
jgi:hypothetical protein